MLLNRIAQTYHGVPQVLDLTHDLRTLLSHTSNLRSHYESRFFLSLERDSDEHLPTIVSNSLNRRDQGSCKVLMKMQASLGAKFQELWEYPKEHCAEDVMNLE